MTVRSKLYDMRHFMRVHQSVIYTFRRAKKNFELNPNQRNEQTYNKISVIMTAQVQQANDFLKWFSDLYLDSGLTQIQRDILFFYFACGYSMRKVADLSYYSERKLFYDLKSLLDKIDKII